MPAWTIRSLTYTAQDEAEFNNIERRPEYYNFLPSDRVSAIWLEENRCVDKGAFGNFLTYRLALSENPGAWIWDERYYFSRRVSQDRNIARGHQKFLEKIGEPLREKIYKIAEAAGGLTLDRKASGLPDVALFVEGNEPEWRFMEAKVVDRGDSLRDVQIKWLKVLTEALGPESVIELQWRMER